MEFGQAFTEAVTFIISKLRKTDTICEVISVNKENNTCKLKITATGFLILDARLLSVVDDFEKKLVVYPKVGSLVSIAYLFGNSQNVIITQYSEVDSILLNGDAFGGLVKADVLKTEIDKFREYTSTLKAATKTSLVALDALLPGTSAVFETAMVGKTTGDFGGIENEKVKHG